LLDSVILIDHLNAVDVATRFLRDAAPVSRVSVITRAEVLAGIEPRDARLVRRWLDGFATLDITSRIADRAAALRRSHGWRLPDAFQAALAREHRLLLATRNTKDFPPERHSFVRVPYRV
jgi:predicted nucleic acid-binding protein